MKHREIMSEVKACLESIEGLRVERDRRQPEGDQELRDNGPLAILYTGERETAPAEESPAIIWSRRWELKPVITVLIADAETDAQRDELERIEDAFITALDGSRLNENDLLARGTGPEFKTEFRHPDAADLGGAEFFLNLTYER